MSAERSTPLTRARESYRETVAAVLAARARREAAEAGELFPEEAGR